MRFRCYFCPPVIKIRNALATAQTDRYTKYIVFPYIRKCISHASDGFVTAIYSTNLKVHTLFRGLFFFCKKMKSNLECCPWPVSTEKYS